MYASFFGLKQDPFSIAPDPHYLFMSERHREALAHLLYGLDGGGGFVLLSGEIGTGKTTVCRCFLEQIPANCNVAYIFNPKLTVNELLRSVCDEFHIPHAPQGPGPETIKDCIDPLNAFLLQAHAAGRNNVLIIDEAQNLSAEVLEQLRLLTNLETNERKLLQIILIGQPELRRMLARPELEQLAQRVIARFHLDALSADETAQYIRHRLAVAGLAGPLPFDAKAMQRIHQLSRGVPRRVNLLCDRALLGAYAHGQATVDRAVVDKAAGEVFGNTQDTAAKETAPGRAAMLGLGLVGGGALAGIVALALYSADQRSAAPVRAAAGTAAVAGGRAPSSSSAFTFPSTSASTSTFTSATASEAASTPSAAASAALLATGADLKSQLHNTALRSENEAWQQLGALWNLSLPEGDACQAAQLQQVPCWRSGNTSLAVIRQLGRPGILTLYDGARRPAYAVLAGLKDGHATLQWSGNTFSVPVAALAELWRGDFATFWRVPPGYGKAGSQGAALSEWLAAQLATVARTSAGASASAAGGAAASGAADSAASAPEAPLRARIAKFQLTQGLTPDGLAGPITLMQLNRAAGVDEPRLQTER